MEILPPLPTSTGFMSGADGERMSWAKYNVGATWGRGLWGGFGYGGQGAVVSREGAISASVANDLLLSNPTVSTIVETLKTHAIGTGLAFSSKLDPIALNITPDEARDLAKEIDRRFRAWASSPLEVDLTGRFNLHTLAAIAFESYLLTGEVVATYDWQDCPARERRPRSRFSTPISSTGLRTPLRAKAPRRWASNLTRADA